MGWIWILLALSVIIQWKKLSTSFFSALTQVIWQKSRLVLDFTVGSPMQFEDWWNWMETMGCIEDVELAIAILWVIWCSRNQATFQDTFLSLEHYLQEVVNICSQLAKYRS